MLLQGAPFPLYYEIRVLRWLSESAALPEIQIGISPDRDAGGIRRGAPARGEEDA
jgi:hypothetical protein